MLQNHEESRPGVALPPSVAERNKDNLSLYSPEEELKLLREIMGEGFLIERISQDGIGMGYVITYQDPSRIDQTIVPGLPSVFLDFDDSSAQTSQDKKLCWAYLEKLGIPEDVVTFCDKKARVTFSADHGSIYEPELDMRLLTRYCLLNDEQKRHWKDELEQYLQELLHTTSATSSNWLKEPVDARIREIFDRTRFSVTYYQDLNHQLEFFRGSSDRPSSNLFLLTYGDPVFQLRKTIKLLREGFQDGSIQGIVLTKAKKGPMLEALLHQRHRAAYAYRDIAIPEKRESSVARVIGRLFKGARQTTRLLLPLLLVDDDPNQLESVKQVAAKIGILVKLLRTWEGTHKRAHISTPESESAIQVERNNSGLHSDDIDRARRDFFAEVLEKWLVEFLREILGEAEVDGSSLSDQLEEMPGIKELVKSVAELYRFNKYESEVGRIVQMIQERQKRRLRDQI